MKTSVNSFFVLLFALLTSACLQDQEKLLEDNLILLTGTVATEVPLVATITVVDSDGKTYATESDSSGKYEIYMGSALGPFLIKAVDTKLPQAQTLYSFSAGVGVANVTEFTSLGLLLAKNTDLAFAFSVWENVNPRWMLQEVRQGMATVNANFIDAFTFNEMDSVFFDFSTTTFDANDVGVDRFLSNYSIDIDYTAMTYSITNISGDTVAFNENVNTAGYFIGDTFLPDENAAWVVTTVFTINGVTEPTKNNFSIAESQVPFSQAMFIENTWSLINDTIAADNVNGELSVEITTYEPSYDLSGNGGVGTAIDASLILNYRVFSVVNGEAVDESHQYQWQWNYRQTL